MLKRSLGCSPSSRRPSGRRQPARQWAALRAQSGACSRATHQCGSSLPTNGWATRPDSQATRLRQPQPLLLRGGCIVPSSARRLPSFRRLPAATMRGPRDSAWAHVHGVSSWSALCGGNGRRGPRLQLGPSGVAAERSLQPRPRCCLHRQQSAWQQRAGVSWRRSALGAQPRDSCWTALCATACCMSPQRHLVGTPSAEVAWRGCSTGPGAARSAVRR
mmetsp:Transcript_29057/g.83278  ORF Transcript_29057/g.83278 Transcript_29057/m.83278 type:complete len:218 (+) Transcript_29057:954-1607(+)